MILKLPDARERLSWTWLPRFVNKANAEAETEFDHLDLPPDVFWAFVERTPESWFDDVNMIDQEALFNFMHIRANPGLSDTVDLYMYEPHRTEGGAHGAD